MTNKELLTDEELDNVTGGTYIQCAQDGKKFNDLGVDVGYQEILGIPYVKFSRLREAFDKFGVKAQTEGGLIKDNKYFIDGKEVTRDQAWEHVMAQINK